MLTSKVGKRSLAFIARVSKSYITAEAALRELPRQCADCHTCGLACNGESCKSCALNNKAEFTRLFNEYAQKRVPLRKAPQWYIDGVSSIRGPKPTISAWAKRLGDERFANLCRKYGIYGETTSERITNILERGEEEFFVYVFLFVEDVEKNDAELRRISKICDNILADGVEDCSDNGPRPDRKVRRQGIIRKRRGW